MTNHDLIVAEMELRRKERGMTKIAFATTVLELQGGHYTELLAGRRKFNVALLRKLYSFGVPAWVLLGTDNPSK